jgi:hypothetical protein
MRNYVLAKLLVIYVIYSLFGAFYIWLGGVSLAKGAGPTFLDVIILVIGMVFINSAIKRFYRMDELWKQREVDKQTSDEL